MTEIICVKKSDNQEQALSTATIIEIFENTNDMDVIRSAVEKANERLYVTWASVEIKDNAGEMIPIQEVIDRQETLMKRNAPITNEHSNKVVGQTIAYKVLKHPETGTMGVLHLDKIFNDYALDDQVWEEIVSGKRAGSSVGGTNSGVEYGFDADGQMVKILKGFDHYETASVYRGCNPMALNEAYSLVAKSDVKKPCEEETYKKDNTQLELGMAVESKEHPDLDDAAVKQLVLDHLKEKPDYYSEQETVINKENTSTNIKKGDLMPEEANDIKKSIESLTEVVKSLSLEVAKLKKEDEEMKEEDMEDKEEDVEKEDAKGDIEGVNEGGSIEAPTEDEDSNEKDVFKSELADVKKQLSNVVKMLSTPKPTASPKPSVQDIKKKEQYDLAHKLATGEVAKTWRELHVLMRD